MECKRTYDLMEGEGKGEGRGMEFRGGGICVIGFRGDGRRCAAAHQRSCSLE